jgi:hypothetical protein
MHILGSGRTLMDPDGAEFADRETALREAHQSVRDLIADELRAGKPAPLDWHVHLTSDDGSISEQIAFADVVVRPSTERSGAPSELALQHAEALSSFAEIRQTLFSIRGAIEDLQQSLRALHRAF